jgi:hypothetical protein
MSSQHTDVAAYSLGLLEQEDRQDFEVHLADCQSCAAELAEFATMADLLSGVEPVGPVGPVESGQEELGDTALGDLIRQRAMARSRRVRLQAVLAAVASLVLLAGGVAVGLVSAPQQPASVAQLVRQGQQHSATNARTGITATIGLVAKTWGTQITMDLAGVRGPLECQLIAVSRTGERRVVTGWFVARAGFGVPGNLSHLLLIGGTAIPEKELSRVEIEVVNGPTLLSISM